MGTTADLENRLAAAERLTTELMAFRKVLLNCVLSIHSVRVKLLWTQDARMMAFIICSSQAFKHVSK